MKRDEAEAIVSALVKYLAAADAAQYSSESFSRANQAKEAYEHLIKTLMGEKEQRDG